jgi:hypothetical protein
VVTALFNLAGCAMWDWAAAAAYTATRAAAILNDTIANVRQQPITQRLDAINYSINQRWEL